MKKRIALASILMLMVAGAAFAQLPPGKWWRQPNIVAMLQLTDEQQDKLEAVFRASANELIDLRAEVEKQSIALRGELDQSQLNRQNIQRGAAKLNDARGKLFARELNMLADMRGVLTDVQWNRMRSQLDRLGKDGMQPMRRGGPGPGGMAPRPSGQGRGGPPAAQPPTR